MLRIYQITLVATVLLAAGIARANLVADGGFESPNVGGYLDEFYAPGVPVSYPSSGSTIDGAWYVASGTVEVVGADFWTSFEGVQSLDLDGISVGAIYQDIPTVADQVYTLSFELAGNTYGGQNPKELLVSAGSSSSPFSFDISGKSPGNMGWTKESLDFTAIGSITRIEFASQDSNPSEQGPVLDDISVTAAMVPLPAALWGGLALFPLCAILRRRMFACKPAFASAHIRL
jgi:choice-of-anchor C domain-containing protein